MGRFASMESWSHPVGFECDFLTGHCDVTVTSWPTWCTQGFCRRRGVARPRRPRPLSLTCCEVCPGLLPVLQPMTSMPEKATNSDTRRPVAACPATRCLQNILPMGLRFVCRRPPDQLEGWFAKKAFPWRRDCLNCEATLQRGSDSPAGRKSNANHDAPTRPLAPLPPAHTLQLPLSRPALSLPVPLRPISPSLSPSVLLSRQSAKNCRVPSAGA